MKQNHEKSIKAIVFDLGGVIVNVDFNKTFEEFENKTGLTNEAIKASTFLTSTYHDYESGYLNDNQFRELVCQNFGTFLQSDSFDSAWNALLGNFNLEALNLIRELKSNYALYLLSNTNRIHFEECNRRLQQQYFETFETLFNGLFLSYKIGYRKPSERIFQHMLSRLGMSPQQILFIDDLEENIRSAESLGINVIHLTDNRKIASLVREKLADYELQAR
ncbi:MAG TPA: HAD family phosphatase [Salinivirgaceae bacterium]|nr:HAD family phosphatase [Salinivirgaceae bacterium]